MKVLILLALVAATEVTSEGLSSHEYMNSLSKARRDQKSHEVINPRFKIKVKADKNLVGTASDLGLTTFLDLATTTGLANTLAQEGPFTVFAPSNEAFSILPDSVLLYLKGNLTALNNLLLYHMYDGNFVSNIIKNELTIPSKLKIAQIRFNVYDDGQVVTANGATFKNFDQMATNGIIHVIDRVLYPIPMDDIVQFLEHCWDFQTLFQAVNIAGLADTLKGDLFTLFAPTEKAFAKMPEAEINALFTNQTALVDRLKYHVVAGTLYSKGLSNNDILTTVEGKPITVKITDDGIKIKDGAGGADVVFANTPVINGVIHVVDTVLAPPEN